MAEEDASDEACPGSSCVMTQALDVISLLKHARLTVVESEPIDAMIAAGMAVSGVSAERTRAVFRAMLAAGGTVGPRLQ